MNTLSRRTTWVVVATIAQLLLVPVAVHGQLSARLSGEEVLLRVGPVDPIDPFRGAYVALSYPDLQPSAEERKGYEDDEQGGALFVVLEEQDGVMVAERYARARPDRGTYLACDDRDWQLRCGIESLFLSQDDAARVQKDINQSGLVRGDVDDLGNPVIDGRDSGYVARIKVDGRGHAAVVGLVKH
jgi:uncharacterized membrane-anchored protein